MQLFPSVQSIFEVDEANELIKSIGEECGLRVVELKKAVLKNGIPEKSITITIRR